MQQLIEKLTCVQCGKGIRGNENKKFCNDLCKNAFHNSRRKQESKEIGDIVTILKTNRRIIADLLDGYRIRRVSGQRLLDKGFVFRYHTHSRINKGDGKEYFFCFDYGYLKHASGWYTLVLGFKDSA